MKCMDWIIGECIECSYEDLNEYSEYIANPDYVLGTFIHRTNHGPCVRFCIDYEQINICEKHLLEILSQKEEFLSRNKNDWR